jgi:hypothetical protein
VILLSCLFLHLPTSALISRKKKARPILWKPGERNTNALSEAQ